MTDGLEYGFKGVVFHVGHHSNPKRGLELMEQRINEILDVVEPECLFILETPCGHANELLSTPEEFATFIKKFPLLKFGACVDTCHVYVSGTMPIDYISRLGSQADRVCLIHFNGSRKQFGQCVDGHCHVTNVCQRLPEEELIEVLKLARAWEVDCVTE
jgi:deoxyribonuclease-4